jgi:HEAT repeat protein
MSASRQNNVSRDRIRIWMLWLLLVMIAVVVMLFRSHPRSPAAQSTKASPNTNAVSPAPPVASQPASVHASAHLSQPGTEPETERLISVMSDKSQSLQLRRQAARSLARVGTDEAMTALKAALASDNPPYLKAAIAEALGESPNPAARDLLQELVNGKDEITARAAARGLALAGDANAVDTLGNILFNEQTPLSVRTEAARSLGDVDIASAQDLLVRAVSQIQDDDVRESVLDGLGRRPFAETETFFHNYLNSPDVSPDSKALAIEAIADADGDVGPFLSNYLNDPNPEVRAAAQSAVDFLTPSPVPEFTNASKKPGP